MDSCQLIELEKIAMVDIAACTVEGKQRESILGYQDTRNQEAINIKDSRKRSSMELKATKKMGHGGAGEAGEVNQGIDIDESTC
ncbi:hypothetical protein Pint_34876 [Pistacia integerrima]|uniref:Uncharacterized protein n=1 Tax=Pistacia integerrima TaxID=434235 RepID=A0ACC0XZQ6_9ROSI|nr:hypothetical protein Pint_34876 [Pistacia integerrima]